MREDSSGKGADKYLDELIVWRELAHNLCFHRHRSLESLAVLPDWTRQRLEEHAGERHGGPSFEHLTRGETGDRLWGLCQASLLRNGELQNNVRRTWGKAIAAWAPEPRTDLRWMIDLNHRFALDGSDPNAHGGLFWCLGLFDRPFQPPQGPLGTVRSRTTASHAKRLDLDAYERKIQGPAQATLLLLTGPVTYWARRVAQPR